MQSLRRDDNLSAARLSPPPGDSTMPLQFRRSWSDPDLEAFRDTVARFVQQELAPGDA